LLITFHSKRGHGNQWNVAQVIISLKNLRDLKPRNLGELDVHENQVGLVLPRDFYNQATVLRLQRVIAMRFETVVEQFHVQLVSSTMRMVFGIRIPI
jgi:hypothetical protein